MFIIDKQHGVSPCLGFFADDTTVESENNEHWSGLRGKRM
jgi:hypothetical protein